MANGSTIYIFIDSHELIHSTAKQEKEMFILKVDINKAFDICK